VLHRLLRGASLGCLLGTGAALSLALCDFGAEWLWLRLPSERALLLLHVAGLQLLPGALLGACAGVLQQATEPTLERLAARGSTVGPAPARRLDALRALRGALLLSPGLIAVAVLLFGGGSIAKLPLLPLWQGLTALASVLGCAGTLYVFHRLERQSRTDPVVRTWLASFALAAGFALGKVDQYAFPKLYEYLHTSLSATSFLCFAAGLSLLPLWPLWPRTSETASGMATGRPAVAAALTLATAAALFAASLGQLESNQNVRVALIHPRTSHTRSFLRAAGPALIAPRQQERQAEALARSRAARARRAALHSHDTGPVLADAHLLLITIDALRADHLGHYGYRRPTSPELDGLAAKSVVFDHAYAPAPHSSYSLCSVMTSEYLHETLDLGRPSPEATLATSLGAAGYHTAAFFTPGIFHTGGERLANYEQSAFGFDLHDHHARPAEQLTDRVLEEIDRTAAAGEPNSFIWAHYFDVHEPYRATEFGTSALDRYDSEIRRVDAAVARLVREARARLSREVVVVLTADHGEEFRDHGGTYHGSTLYEEQVRIPLLINARGLEPRRVRIPVSTIDLAPTALALLGLTMEPTMRGADLRPLCTGHATESAPVFSAVSHMKMALRWPHKLIANLRFGIYELYDLEADPQERNNLADSNSQLLSELRTEIYGWLDSLSDRESTRDPHDLALARGRVRDRRAVPGLEALLASPEAPREARMEAAQLLGHLRDDRAKGALFRGMKVADASVAAEAAIALGRMYDERAKPALKLLVQSPDRGVRTRAAISLGRLRDRAAVPALIEALEHAETKYDREEAVRWLGRLRDPRAVEPLIELLPDTRRRYLTLVALGLIGDLRAFEPIQSVRRWARHENVLDNAVRALGQLGDRRGLEGLVELAIAEPSLKNMGETLVRLGALEAGEIGGTDVAPASSGKRGFGHCIKGPLVHDWDYLRRTRCTTTGRRATLKLAIPEAMRSGGAELVGVLAAKRQDGPGPARLRLELDGRALTEGSFDASWSELRFAVDGASLRRRSASLQLVSEEPQARFTVDHLLLLPKRATAVARHDP